MTSEDRRGPRSYGDSHTPLPIADFRATVDGSPFRTQLTHLDVRTEVMQMRKTEILARMADLKSELEMLDSDLNKANGSQKKLIKRDKLIYSLLKDVTLVFSNVEHLKIADALAACTSDEQPLAQTQRQAITGHDFSTIADQHGEVNDVIVNRYLDLFPMSIRTEVLRWTRNSTPVS
ncbi:MAG: hypothetical protein M1816_005250 [Peltula sp. TS41687]|nr:MAG: hypothetical protein M1816_005250 [Peltula sp. TS41687]